MELWDILVTGAIVVIAVWYLYRKIVVNKGCSCGSSSCAAKTGKDCKKESESSDR